MRMRTRVLAGIGSLVMGAGISAGTTAAYAAPPEMVTICHIAGHAEPDNANEIELTLSERGLRGHFDESGTPLAGHEEDRLGPCGGQPA